MPTISAYNQLRLFSRNLVRFSSTSPSASQKVPKHDKGKLSTNSSLETSDSTLNAYSLADEDTGYMRRRLEQLKEDSYSPSSSLDFKDNISTPGTLPQDSEMKSEDHPDLHEIIEKISKSTDQNQAEFDAKYQRELEMARMPTYLESNKHARDIATAKIWDGNESQYEASFRMLNDAYKPLKIKQKTTKTGSAPMFTPKLTVRERVNNAKEGALDYQISKLAKTSKQEHNKGKSLSNEEDDGFKEMYRERLLGPSQFLNDSFASVDNSIKSLADQKIMESQRRGDFKNLSNRGKPLPRDYTSDGTFIDRTEYHLNNILKRQDAIPPWIEKQGSVTQQVKFFREQLDLEWRKKAVLLIEDLTFGKSTEEKCKTAQKYADAENELDTSLPKLRSKEWEDAQMSYLKTKINSLNDSLRGYNLQAPLASQRTYLIAEKELASSYKRVASQLVPALQRHILDEKERERNPPPKPTGPGPLKYSEVHQRQIGNIYQAPTDSLGSMFLSLFKRSD